LETLALNISVSTSCHRRKKRRECPEFGPEHANSPSSLRATYKRKRGESGHPFDAFFEKRYWLDRLKGAKKRELD